MVACGYASTGALQEYAQGIEALNNRYPNSWSQIGPLEERMREHTWVEVHEGLLALEPKDRPGAFRAERPWDYVIKHTAYGREHPAPRQRWWERGTETLWLPQHSPTAITNHPDYGSMNLPQPPTQQPLSQQAIRAQQVHLAQAVAKEVAKAVGGGQGSGGRGDGGGRPDGGRGGGGGRGDRGRGAGGRGGGGGRGDRGGHLAIVDGCTICGAPDHNHNNCPDRVRKGDKPKDKANKAARAEQRKRAAAAGQPEGGRKKKKGGRGGRAAH